MSWFSTTATVGTSTFGVSTNNPNDTAAVKKAIEEAERKKTTTDPNWAVWTPKTDPSGGGKAVVPYDPYNPPVPVGQVDPTQSGGLKDILERAQREQARIRNFFPEGWPDVYKMNRIKEWREKNQFSRDQLYAALWEDRKDTDWYAINTLIGDIPIEPGSVGEVIENEYYNFLLPWAAVRNEWAHSLIDVSEWPLVERLRRENYTVRAIQAPTLDGKFTIAGARKKLPDAGEVKAFSYTALFLAAGALLITMLVKL